MYFILLIKDSIPLSFTIISSPKIVIVNRIVLEINIKMFVLSQHSILLVRNDINIIPRNAINIILKNSFQYCFKEYLIPDLNRKYGFHIPIMIARLVITPNNTPFKPYLSPNKIEKLKFRIASAIGAHISL